MESFIELTAEDSPEIARAGDALWEDPFTRVQRLVITYYYPKVGRAGQR